MIIELPPFLHDLLDRRIDPLDDATARAWLEAHPESLESFATLRCHLAALPPAVRQPGPAPGRRRPWPFVGVAAAAAAVLITLTLRDRNPATTPLPRPEFATDGVVAWTASTRELGAARSHEIAVAGHTRIATERLVCLLSPQGRQIAVRTTERTTTAP